jgi:hypothetical protein
MLGKRSDFTGRSVITPGPDLNVNEIGIPFRLAIPLFEPFIIYRIFNTNMLNKSELENEVKAFTGLELSIDTMLKTGNKICFSDPIKKDLNGNIMIPFGIPTTSEGVTYEQLKIVNSIFISTVVVETDLLKSIGYFNSEFDAIEDWDLWLRILRNNSYCRHKENTVTYNVNPNGMAGKSTNQKMNKMLFQYLVIDQPLVKLNLGCGDERIPGYINCDLYEPTADAQFDAKLIPLPDNSVDEIRAYHLIEHFTFHTAFDVLKEWKRVLKPNGKLVLETPDFYQSCKRFVWACEENNNDEQIRLYSHFFAWPDLSHSLSSQ